MVNWDYIFSTQDGAPIWQKCSQTLKEAIDFAVSKKSAKKQQRSLWEMDSVRLA